MARWAQCLIVGLVLVGHGGWVGASDLLIYEGFDIAPGTLHGAAGESSFGFEGNWVIHSGAGSVVAPSFAYPAGVDYEPVGGRLEHVSGTDFNFAAHRLLSAENKFGLGPQASAVTTRYLSVLVRKSTPGTSFDHLFVGYGWQDTSSFTQANNLRGGAGGNNDDWAVIHGADPGDHSQSDFFLGDSDTTLLIMKLIATPNQDTLAFLAAYASTDTVGAEPAVWTSTHSFAADVMIDRISIIGGKHATIQVDEIRIGQTWESVTVPEPGSLALACLAGLAMFRRRR